MLAVAALVAGIAAATTAADYAPQIAKVTQNVANSLIPTFGLIDRDSPEMRALNAAPTTTLAA
jgi:hypothetical protein